MLTDLTAFDTTDPRDHVYGILGMYQRFTPASRRRGSLLPPALRPNYKKEPQDVFRDATRFSFGENGRLDALQVVNHWSTKDIEQEYAEWSTWVPRWDRKWTRQYDPADFFVTGAGAAGKEFANPTTAPLSPEILSLRGFTVDSVHATTPTFTVSLLGQSDMFCGILQKIDEIVTDLEGDLDDIGPILTTSKSYNRTPVPREQSIRGHRTLIRRLETGHNITHLAPLQQTDAGHSDAEVAEEHYRAICQWCCNRKFFITKSGYMGLGPKIMQEGDLVTVFGGSALPIVLRRRGGRGEMYAMVGVAYVGGIMDGEVFDAKKDAREMGVMFNLV
jgi:hypothetical protein